MFHYKIIFQITFTKLDNKYMNTNGGIKAYTVTIQIYQQSKLIECPIQQCWVSKSIFCTE